MNKIRIPTPTAITQQANTTVLNLDVSAELIFFPGHFPSHAILPGVVIIDWAIEFAAQYLNVQPAEPLQLEVIKFKQLVEVGMQLQLHLTHNVEKNKLSFALMSATGEHSSGRIVLSPSLAADILYV